MTKYVSITGKSSEGSAEALNSSCRCTEYFMLLIFPFILSIHLKLEAQPLLQALSLIFLWRM